MVRPKLTEQREIVEALRTDYSVRQICEVLGFTRSNLYYHSKQDPFEAVLRDEIETLALRYPTYGYRRITKLLVRMGYTVGSKCENASTYRKTWAKYGWVGLGLGANRRTRARLQKRR